MADEKTPGLLTDDERELLDMPYDPWPFRQGYHTTLDATGVPAIDRVLAAIGYCAKFSHGTEGWSDEADFTYGPIAKGTEPQELIQRAANEAAAEIRILAAQAQELRHAAYLAAQPKDGA